MEESVTYQATLRKGRELGRQEEKISTGIHWVIKMGTKLFGTPSKDQLDLLHSITTNEAIESIEQKIDNATSWDELLK